MAITQSGLYLKTFADSLKVTNSTPYTVVTAASLKIALFDNTHTPVFYSDQAFAAAPFTTGQVSGTGWAAGGPLLSVAATGNTSTAPTYAAQGSTNFLMYDMGDISQSGVTVSNVVASVIYLDAVSTAPAKPALVLTWFGGGSYSPSNGVFGITWDANGVYRIATA
jgi:hypothetical protein